jgi:Arc/MetJ-type ribon-helix-helix transcriptional regulator
MKRLGRPAGDPRHVMGVTVGVTMSPALRDELKRAAEAEGYESLSAYIRERRLAAPAQEGETREQELRTLRAALRRIAQECKAVT